MVLVLVLVKAVTEGGRMVEAVPQADRLGLREGAPLGEPLGEPQPEALWLPNALPEAQVVGKQEGDAVVVALAQWLLQGEA